MNEQDKALMLSELALELECEEQSVDLAKLEIKLNNAIRDVIRAVNYPASWTVENIQADLKQYYGNIHDLTLYDYNQIGGEGEESHSENGTSRKWKDRRACFSGIYPFASSVTTVV